MNQGDDLLPQLTHVDAEGRARMVDVSEKAITRRTAVARSQVRARPETIRLLASGRGPKGDVFAVARVGGIQAAKQTSQLIPMCHALGLDHVDIDFAIGQDIIGITATATTTGRTGVEMEAMTAASIAGLVIYDMAKAVDREMQVGPVELVAKSGGRSGTWQRGETS